MSKFKTSRPDPSKILEEMRQKMAEVSTLYEMIQQSSAEATKHNEEMEKARLEADEQFRGTMKPFEDRGAEMNARQREIVEEFTEAQQKYMMSAIEALGMLVEDMDR